MSTTPDKGEEKANTSEFTGGYVVTPSTTGTNPTYKNYLPCWDTCGASYYASLYPSIIRSVNIDPTPFLDRVNDLGMPDMSGEFQFDELQSES